MRQWTLWNKVDRELYYFDKMHEPFRRDSPWFQERVNVYSSSRWKVPKLWR